MILNDPALCRRRGPSISFTVDGCTLTAAEGMTWGEWCASSYNTVGMYTEKYTVLTGAYQLVCLDNSHCVADEQGYVNAGDGIVPGGAYSLAHILL